MSLAEQQSRFLERILDEDTGALSPGEAVYHHAYRNRLAEALGESFERVWSWLGDEAFYAAAMTHVGLWPPSSWTLDDFGEGFDGTLAGLYRDDPEVAELAWLDWALRKAFSGPDATEIDPAALAAADWSVARLILAPTFRHRLLHSNAVAIWQALARSEAPPAPLRLDQTAGLVVWRQGLDPLFRTVDSDEYEALLSLNAGLSFAAVCEDLAARYPDMDTTGTASQWLTQWLQSGLVCGIG